MKPIEKLKETINFVHERLAFGAWSALAEIVLKETVEKEPQKASIQYYPEQEPFYATEIPDYGE